MKSLPTIFPPSRKDASNSETMRHLSQPWLVCRCAAIFAASTSSDWPSRIPKVYYSIVHRQQLCESINTDLLWESTLTPAVSLGSQLRAPWIERVSWLPATMIYSPASAVSACRPRCKPKAGRLHVCGMTNNIIGERNSRMTHTSWTCEG